MVNFAIYIDTWAIVRCMCVCLNTMSACTSATHTQTNARIHLRTYVFIRAATHSRNTKKHQETPNTEFILLSRSQKRQQIRVYIKSCTPLTFVSFPSCCDTDDIRASDSCG